MPKHNKPLSGGNNWNRKPDKIKHNKKHNNNPWSQNYGQDEESSVYGNNIPSYKYSQPQLLTPEELLSPIDENGQKLANFASRVVVNVWQRKPFSPPQSRLSFSENEPLLPNQYENSPKYPHSKGGLSFDGEPKVWEKEVVMQRGSVNNPLARPYNPYKVTEFRVDRDMDILIAFDDEYKRKMGWDKDEKRFDSETEKIAKRIAEIYTNNGFDVTVLVVTPWNLETFIKPYNYPQNGFEGFNIFSVLFMGEEGLGGAVGTTYHGAMGNRSPLKAEMGYDPLSSCFMSFYNLQDMKKRLSMSEKDYDEYLAQTTAHELYHALTYRAYILNDYFSAAFHKKKPAERAKNGYCEKAHLYTSHDEGGDELIYHNIKIVEYTPDLKREKDAFVRVNGSMPLGDYDTYTLLTRFPSFVPYFPPLTSFTEDKETKIPSLRLPGHYMCYAFGVKQTNSEDATEWYDFFHETAYFWEKETYPNKVRLTEFHPIDKKRLDIWHIYWGKNYERNFKQKFAFKFPK